MVSGGSERREFFRINDRLLLEYRQVSYEESVALERNIRDSQFLLSAANRVPVEHPGAPSYVRDLFDRMEVLNQKLNMVIDLLERRDGLFHGGYSDVEISGAGVRYLSKEKLEEGSYLELRIVLPSFPCPRIAILGKVARCLLVGSGREESWDVAIRFEGVGEGDRDMLINYIFSKERERLRIERAHQSQ
jgi:hypothetical protein